MQRYDELVAAFRPTATVPTHIEVMNVIAEVKTLIKERDEAKTKQKQDRLASKIEAKKTQAVWIFYGKPANLEDIK